jgi:hypothetical protein
VSDEGLTRLELDKVWQMRVPEAETDAIDPAVAFRSKFASIMDMAHSLISPASPPTVAALLVQPPEVVRP